MKLYRVEGTKTWVTYIACDDSTDRKHAYRYAEDALNDDRDGESYAEPSVSSLLEVPLDSEKSAEEWLARIKEDGWLDSEPFVSGTVADEFDEDRSCKQIIEDHIESLRAKKRAEEEAQHDAEIDAQQTELPISDDHV